MIGVIYLTTLAAVFIVMGFAILWRRVSLVLSGKWSVGRFVRWEVRGLRTKYFHPVVSFEAADGNTYEFVGGPGATHQNPKERYSVVYPKDNPQAAMVHSLLAYWAAPFAFFVLGGGAAVAALNQ